MIAHSCGWLCGTIRRRRSSLTGTRDLFFILLLLLLWVNTNSMCRIIFSRKSRLRRKNKEWVKSKRRQRWLRQQWTAGKIWKWKTCKCQKSVWNRITTAQRLLGFILTLHDVNALPLPSRSDERRYMKIRYMEIEKQRVSLSRPVHCVC